MQPSARDGTLAVSESAGADSLFDCGTLLKLRMRADQQQTRERNIVVRAILAVLVGWVPLLLLAAYQSAVFQDEGVLSLLSDIAVSCRSLVAAPLLVLAEWMCVPRLGAIAHHFRESGLVAPSDGDRFDKAWTSTLRLRSSFTADVVIVVLAYAILTALMSTVSLSAYPGWHVSSNSGSASYSPAGWWHAVVSIPLLLILFLAWMWRVVLWARFLFLISSLDLRLVPAHPDRAGGLRFVGYSVQAFAPVGLALGFIAAGSAANRVIYSDATLESVQGLVIALVAFVVVVFAGPMVAFFFHLLRAWGRGTFEYGAIAGKMGREFEQKWLRPGVAIDETTLAVPDFSATTDLYQVASNVYVIRIVPVGLFSLGLLIVMTGLPFLGVVLLFTPVDVIVREIAALLL